MQEKNDPTFTYVFKPTLLFFCAHVVNATLHELSHAVTAALLGVPATLHHYYVNTDPANAPDSAKLAIAFAGPVTSLVLGILFLLLYRNAVRSGMKLFLLYAGIMGLGIFLGNMFSATFGGDFNRVVYLLHFSSGPRYLVSFSGLVLSVLFMWRMGKEFLRFFIPQNHSRIKVIVYTILIPWLAGVVLLSLAYWPLPSRMVISMVAGSAFWLFTLLGSLTARSSMEPAYSVSAINWMDLVWFVLAVVAVRILVTGIVFFS